MGLFSPSKDDPRRCIPCEEHAELHKGNWFALGKQEPCQQCEEHAVLHARGR